MKEFLDNIDDVWWVRPGTLLEKATLNFFHECWATPHGVPKTFFPGPQPVSIERKHFEVLREKQYLVCEKSDGVRWVFVCFTFQEKKVCTLINRALRIRWLNLNVGNSARKGTLLDGELIGSKFLVYDAVRISGCHCGNKSLPERLELADIFCSGVMKLAHDHIRLVPKKFRVLTDAEDYIKNEMTEVEHETDGLIFTPVEDPIRIGTHETMFKWKPQNKNTIDFQVRWEKRGVWGLYIQDKGMLYFQTEITPDTFPWLKENMIVECRYRHWEYPMWWEPLNIRTDKTYPNNRRTFYRTLVNIQEDIKIEEFYKFK